MTHDNNTSSTIHEGRNIKRPDSYREEILGIKQDALVLEQGDPD